MERPFLRGLELAERYYREAVGPALRIHAGDIRHTAALIGSGSDVLGFDTTMSTDHGWGARTLLFLTEPDFAGVGSRIAESLSADLPETFLGFPTGASQDGSRGVTVTTFERYFDGWIPHARMTAADWLTIPSQELRSVTAGRVFKDDLGLEEIRTLLAYYPSDIWLYLLGSVWTRIGQDEHLVARAGFVGDELGARIIASRLVRDMMNLAFLYERVYAPYPKWFGSAFGRLECGPELGEALDLVLRSEDWQARDKALMGAYRLVAKLHNRSGLTAALPEEPGLFHERPFHVIDFSGGFAQAILGLISDPEVLRITARGAIGAIDIFSDSTDLTSHRVWRSSLRTLYSH